MRLLEKVVIRLPLGLNMRAASQLVLIANRFHCGIRVQKSANQADAKSLLGLLTLGGQPGNELEVYFDGRDAEEASAAIREFFEEGPGALELATVK